MGWSETNVDKMARLRILRANGENIKLVTRDIKNIDENKIIEQEKVVKMIKKEKYKREAGISFAIPELKYGDYEMREKLKEIVGYKAI